MTMPDLTVSWIKCTNDVWCSFAGVNLDNDHFNNLRGVYIIWNSDTVVRVGSGIIKDRIAAHREDDEISDYDNLKVTWAKVNATQMEGVEKYLADELDPAVGERFPDRTAISVNFPW